jgi:hypothetical protein
MKKRSIVLVDCRKGTQYWGKDTSDEYMEKHAFRVKTVWNCIDFRIGQYLSMDDVAESIIWPSDFEMKLVSHKEVK